MSSLDASDPVVAPRDARSRELRSVAGMLGRHQIASLLSTAVDFGTMTLIVELVGGSAVIGTFAGASLGAVTNFQLGRHFTFEARQGQVAGQAARYAAVSAASAGWNALGEHVLHDRFGMQYLLARIIVAVAVSLLWNFPLQKRFVFQQSASSPISPKAAPPADEEDG